MDDGGRRGDFVFELGRGVVVRFDERGGEEVQIKQEIAEEEGCVEAGDPEDVREIRLQNGFLVEQNLF